MITYLIRITLFMTPAINPFPPVCGLCAHENDKKMEGPLIVFNDPDTPMCVWQLGRINEKLSGKDVLE